VASHIPFSSIVSYMSWASGVFFPSEAHRSICYAHLSLLGIAIEGQRQSRCSNRFRKQSCDDCPAACFAQTMRCEIGCRAIGYYVANRLCKRRRDDGGAAMRYLMVVPVFALFAITFAVASHAQGWQPPGWTNPNTNPGPVMPKPQPTEPTPGDDPKLNPQHDPDVKNGINNYCKDHRGGVCG
jgi:hypothetical protein